LAEQERRSIQLDSAEALEGDYSLLPSAVEMWRLWITEIIKDPEMNRDRIMRHVQLHVGNHMPNADATKERWEAWLAGTYNLLAILAANLGMDPPHAVGIDLLLRKYLADPMNHTPPPKKIKKVVEQTRQKEKDWAS
jgi:hypothetical protein